MNSRLIAEQRAQAELPSRFSSKPKQPLGGSYPGRKRRPKPTRTRDRAEQRRMAKERRRAEGRRKAKARTLGKLARHYWITPKANGRTCFHCKQPTAIAIRPRDQRAACADCIDRLEIEARESELAAAWTGTTIRHVEPGADWIRPGEGDASR